MLSYFLHLYHSLTFGQGLGSLCHTIWRRTESFGWEEGLRVLECPDADVCLIVRDFLSLDFCDRRGPLEGLGETLDSIS